MASRTFKSATTKFVKSLGDLSADEEPLVVGLQQMAKALDDRFQAATYTQYRRTHGDLLKMRGGADTHDPLDDFLET